MFIKNFTFKICACLISITSAEAMDSTDNSPLLSVTWDKLVGTIISYTESGTNELKTREETCTDIGFKQPLELHLSYHPTDKERLELPKKNINQGETVVFTVEDLLSSNPNPEQRENIMSYTTNKMGLVQFFNLDADAKSNGYVALSKNNALASHYLIPTPTRSNISSTSWEFVGSTFVYGDLVVLKAKERELPSNKYGYQVDCSIL